ncbi:MAG: hypothetical protein LBO06_00820 [Bacteroidales bacterium]|nr:hypothetical protein [Bacteroidales bacterium]
MKGKITISFGINLLRNVCLNSFSIRYNSTTCCPFMRFNEVAKVQIFSYM